MSDIIEPDDELAQIEGTNLLFWPGKRYDGWPNDWAKLTAQEVAQQFLEWLGIPADVSEPTESDKAEFLLWVSQGRLML